MLLQPTRALLLLFFFELLKQQMVKGEALTEGNELLSSTLLLRIPDFLSDPLGNVVMNPTLQWALKSPSFHIRADESLASMFSQAELYKAAQLCEDALRAILKGNVQWLPRGQIIDELKSGQLEIVLVLKEYCSSTRAYYAAGTPKKMSVLYRSEYRVEDYQRIMFNEFSHYTVSSSNDRCGMPCETSSLQHYSPYLNKVGEIDPVLAEKFSSAINQGLENFDRLREIWQRRSTKLVPTERTFLHDFISAVRHVKLFSAFHSPLSQIKGSITEHLESGLWQLDQDGVFMEQGPAWPKNNMPFFKGRLKNDCFVFHSSKPGRPTFLKDKVNEFFLYLGGMRDAFFDESSKILEDSKTYQNKATHIMEYASFIQEFPQEVLKVVFPKFLQLTTRDALRCSASALKEEEHIEPWKPSTLNRR